MPALTDADRALIARFVEAGQGHVFRFLDRLPPHQAGALLAQAARIDLAAVARLAAAPADAARPADGIEPPAEELVPLATDEAGRRRRREARERGIEELRAGRLAVLVAAGGQGTRMGTAAPKGLWPVGPATGKPLLQWHAEKVLYWTRRVGRPLWLLVLVSEATQRATEDFFRWHGWFGLDPTCVRFPCQASLPALDDAGRLLLESPGRIAMAPNGHGGLFAALRDARLLDLLADRGVAAIACSQVDNPLVRTVDPAFVGLHAARGAEISSKSVRKRDAGEKVGVFARVAGRPALVEYTELPEALARAVAPDGSLLFGHGSIAAHCVDVAFARRVAAAGLPLHRARKKVPHVDADGGPVAPAEPNATKFESFLFDAIPLAERSLVVETARADEFSPIKSNDGPDSPTTARADLIALFTGWHRRAGLPLPASTPEVSPAVAPDEDEFRRLHGLGPA